MTLVPLFLADWTPQAAGRRPRPPRPRQRSASIAQIGGMGDGPAGSPCFTIGSSERGGEKLPRTHASAAGPRILWHRQNGRRAPIQKARHSKRQAIRSTRHSQQNITTALVGTKREEGMRYVDRKSWPLKGLATVSVCVLGLLAAGKTVQAADVVVPGSTDFPESVSASSDGTLYFSSFGNGRIWRAKPGETTASEFIKTGSNGLASALGVLADDKSNTLYVCSDDFSAAGIKIPGATATSLKLFDLKTGEAKGSIPTPGSPTLCNDIVVASDGSAYITDSFSGQILRLKPGAKELEVWTQDPRWKVEGKAQLDGIAILPDGAVYANIFEGDGLYRIEIKPDGGTGAITKLQTLLIRLLDMTKGTVLPRRSCLMSPRSFFGPCLSG